MHCALEPKFVCKKILQRLMRDIDLRREILNSRNLLSHSVIYAHFFGEIFSWPGYISRSACMIRSCLSYLLLFAWALPRSPPRGAQERAERFQRRRPSSSGGLFLQPAKEEEDIKRSICCNRATPLNSTLLAVEEETSEKRVCR